MWIAKQAGLAVALSLLLGAAAQAQTSEELVREYLRQEYGVTGGYSLNPVTDAYVGETFPGLDFFGLQFVQYPIAYLAPKGLSASNVAIVFDGQVFILTDSGQLRDLFLIGLPPAQSEAQARDALRTYLRLTEEFVQDMFYTFGEPSNVVSIVDDDGT